MCLFIDCLIDLTDSYRDRERREGKRERLRLLIASSLTEMAKMARPGLGHSQEPGTPSRASMWGVEDKHLGHNVMVSQAQEQGAGLEDEQQGCV